MKNENKNNDSSKNKRICWRDIEIKKKNEILNSDSYFLPPFSSWMDKQKKIF